MDAEHAGDDEQNLRSFLVALHGHICTIRPSE